MSRIYSKYQILRSVVVTVTTAYMFLNDLLWHLFGETFKLNVFANKSTTITGKNSVDADCHYKHTSNK